MTYRSCRFGFTLAFLGFAATLPPAIAQAQSPVYVTQWGTFGNGNGQFQYPRGIATDAAGNVYVMDTSNYRLEKFTGTGAYITQWGFAGHTAGHFELPFGVAVDAAGNVYVADTYNSRIQKFIGDGVFLGQWGFGGTANGRFSLPQGVAVDAAGNVYVADTQNNRVQKFTSGGAFLTKWGTQGSGNGQFLEAWGVTTDAAGNVYVSDAGNNRIQKFSSTGAYITQWGSPGNGEGQFDLPFGMACDAAGDIYVADLRNSRIQKFTNTGGYLLQWGNGDDNDYGFMNSPQGVAIDPAGDIYVADTGNSRILKFRQSRAVSFDLDPNTLNLHSHGRWVTGYLEPESPLAAGDIDIASIRLNGAVPVDSGAPTALGDHDGDGVPDLMVKFSRSAVELIVSQGDSVPVTVSGKLGTTPIIGTDHIRVIRGVVLAPQAGSQLTSGAVAQVRWDTPGDVTVTSVDLLQSLDGGGTWSLIASGHPNTGSYDWRVPSVQSIQAKVAVVADEAGAGAGVGGVLGVSEAFSIAAPVGVNDGAPARFEMLGVAPNPAQRQFRVSFSLRDSRAATLELFDVSGRRVEARQLDGMGAGRQSVMLGGQGQLPVGLYIIRLTQDGRSLTTRAAIVR